MSYDCIKCQGKLVELPPSLPSADPPLDPAVENPIASDQHKLIPNENDPIMKEFLQARNAIIQALKDLGSQDKDLAINFDTFNPEIHAICESCLNSINTKIEKETKSEEDAKIKTQTEIDHLSKDIFNTEKKVKDCIIDDSVEKSLLEKLKALENEEEDQKRELDELGQLQIETEQDEKKYWDEMLNFEKKLYLLNEKKHTASSQLKEIQSEIDRLSRINVLSDVVNISAEHEVAKVNNLMLGKTFDAANISWIDTNAALGQLVLLFSILEYKSMGFRFDKIKMKPQGSFSEVVRVTEGKEENYEVYGPPKDEVRFNRGLFTLLEALGQIHTFFMAQLSSMKGGTYDLPHLINADNIGGIPFVYSPTKLDKWTEVLKYFSLNCKHLIYLYSLFEKNKQISIKSAYVL